jgi:signal transduction histidine kinase
MVLMVGQDITPMKRLETSLRDQSEKLVEAIDEVSLYNDLMIHDIHNANAGIMGYLELLNLGGLTDDKRKNYIVRALKEVKKSSSIIKDVKVMSMVRPVGETVPIDLVTTFEKVIRTYCSDQVGAPPKIDMNIADLQVLADDLIEEAIVRILGHSLMNMNASQININAKRDPSRSNLVPEPVHIVIGTNGKGITDEMIEVVFNRPKRTDLGSHGLGLYLVKKIIDRFGGMVWVERSKDGKNIEVHILLREAV